MILLTKIEKNRHDRGYLCVIFEVRTKVGPLLHAENTGASDVMRWDMSWISNDRIRLKSSDIGSYDWIRQPDGSWQKETASTGAKDSVPRYGAG